MAKNKTHGGNASYHILRIAFGILALVSVISAYAGVAHADQAVPAAPTGLSVSAVDGTSIRLSWQDNSNNEVGFEISNGDTSVKVGANTNSYTWSGLTPGKYMCFMVRAYNAAGSSAYTPYACTTTLTVPAAPTGTQPAVDATAGIISFLFYILPIIIGVGVYYSSTKYPSVITRIDSFANWIHKKREGIKEDKSWWSRYIKYIIFVPFNLLMRLTTKIENESIRSGTRVAVSIYLSYFELFVLELIVVIAMVIAIIIVALIILAFYFSYRNSPEGRLDAIESELRKLNR